MSRLSKPSAEVTSALSRKISTHPLKKVVDKWL